MQKEIAQKILLETEQGYDAKATSFSDTRQRSWDLEFIAEYIKAGDKVLDFGCGNGRLLEKIQDKQIEYVGADVSQKLLALAKAKYPAFAGKFVKLTGQTIIPLADNFFNAVVSVAVFHHLPSKEVRMEAAQELLRVTAPGGRVVVTVWNLWQRKYVGKIIYNWLQKILGRSELDWNDCRIAFAGNADGVFERYHHAFTSRELKKLFFVAGFRVEKVEVVNNRNIVLVGRKLS